MLCDGLAPSEFQCGGEHGDDGTTTWYRTEIDQAGRGIRLVQTILEMFEKGISFLCTQENDHADWILMMLQEVMPSIRMKKLSKYDKPGKSNAQKFLRIRLKTADQAIRSRYETEYGIDDDCLAVYYDSSKVRLLSFSQFPLSEKKGVKTLGGIVRFQTVRDGIIFNVVNAHLKSGEKAPDAEVRVKETVALLEGIRLCCSPEERVIICMDSNSSDMYRSADDKGFVDEVKKLLIKGGFSETIFENCENIKMRHGSGNQPKKFGWFFMDLIDKIFFRGKAIECKQVDLGLETFVPYNRILSPEEIEKLLTVRKDPRVRQSLHEIVRKQEWSDRIGFNKYGSELEDNDVFPQKLQRVLYPRGGRRPAPSDHSPLVVEISLTSTSSELPPPLPPSDS